MNRSTRLYGLLLLTSLLALPAQAALVGYWQFNAASGTSAADSSGAAHPGILTNMATPSVWVAGYNGNALNFDGVNDFVSVADHADVDMSTAFTFSAWIKITSLPSGANLRTIISKNTNYAVHVTSTGAINWRWQNSSSVARTLVSPAGKVVAGTWVHVAVRYASGAQAIFINGVSVATSTYSETLKVNTNPLLIGQNFGNTNRFLGLIDDVHLYNNARTDADLTVAGGALPACKAGAFGDGLQSHVAGGSITLSNNAQVINAIDPVLPSSSGTVTSGSSGCGTTACTARGTPAAIFNPGPFPSTSGFATNVTVSSGGSATLGSAGNQYNSIVADNNATLVFSGQTSWYINSLTLNNGVTASFAPGNYWIRNLSIGNNAIINVTGSGTVRLYIGTSATISNNARINSPSSGSTGTVSQLFIYGYNDLIIDNNDTVSAIIYAVNNLTLNNNAAVFGAASAANITMNNNSIFTYDATGIVDIDLGGGCGGTVPAASALTLTAASSASTCGSLPVTLAAVDSTGALVTDYTGTVTLSTSSGHGTWSASAASGTLTAGADTGGATYTFVAADNGDAVFNLSNVHADDLTITANDGTLSITSSSIGFRDNIFAITSVDPLGSDIVAGRDHAMKVGMWQKDPTTGVCSVATNYTGSKNLKAWIARVAGTDPGGTAPTIGALSLPSSLPAANYTATFTSGTHTFNLSSTDVGKYAINFQDDSLTFTNRSITGSSNIYVVRPFGFAVDFSGDRATNGTGGSSYANDATKTPTFAKAGQAFATTVRAVTWQAADDSNGDGLPDAVSNLYNNGTTAAFNAGTTLSANLVAPVGGTLGTLANTALTGFSGGAKTAAPAPTYSEVGIINVTATSSAYLGGTVNVSGTALNVGRFYPDHFAVASSLITPFCSTGTAFTYIGQSFPASFTLRAENASNALTTNYVSSATASANFAKLAPSTQMGYAAADTTVAPATSLTSRLQTNSSTGSWPTVSGSGRGSAAISANFALQRLSGTNGGTKVSGPYANFATGIKPVDSDGVALASFDLDTDANSINDAKILGVMAERHGRLVLDNAVGSELAALPIPTRLEYYNGPTIGFVLNSDDDAVVGSAASLSAASFSLSGFGGNLSNGETALTYSAGSAGRPSLSLSAPGNGNSGSLNVTGALVPAWLRFDWNTATAGDDLPNSHSVFGAYNGVAPVIYRRETYR